MMNKIGKNIFRTIFLIVLFFAIPMYAKAEIVKLEPEEIDDCGIHLIQKEGYVSDAAECTVQFDFDYNKLTLYYYDADGNFVQPKYNGEHSIDIVCSEKSAGGKVQRDDGTWIEFSLEISSLDKQAPFQSGYIDKNFNKYKVFVQDSESGVKNYILNGNVIECNGAEKIEDEYDLSEFPNGVTSFTLSSEDMVGNVRDEEVCYLEEGVANLDDSKNEITEDNLEENGKNIDYGLEQNVANDKVIQKHSKMNDTENNSETEIVDEKKESKNIKGLLYLSGMIIIVVGAIVFAFVGERKKKSSKK